ncbi:MAG: hypothetical protein V1647_03950 [Pseudomonadota bacterium]
MKKLFSVLFLTIFSGTILADGGDGWQKPVTPINAFLNTSSGDYVRVNITEVNTGTKEVRYTVEDVSKTITVARPYTPPKKSSINIINVGGSGNITMQDVSGSSIKISSSGQSKENLNLSGIENSDISLKGDNGIYNLQYSPASVDLTFKILGNADKVNVAKLSDVYTTHDASLEANKSIVLYPVLDEKVVAQLLTKNSSYNFQGILKSLGKYTQYMVMATTGTKAVIKPLIPTSDKDYDELEILVDIKDLIPYQQFDPSTITAFRERTTRDYTRTSPSDLIKQQEIVEDLLKQDLRMLLSDPDTRALGINISNNLYTFFATAKMNDKLNQLQEIVYETRTEIPVQQVSQARQNARLELERLVQDGELDPRKFFGYKGELLREVLLLDAKEKLELRTLTSADLHNLYVLESGLAIMLKFYTAQLDVKGYSVAEEAYNLIGFNFKVNEFSEIAIKNKLDGFVDIMDENIRKEFTERARAKGQEAAIKGARKI